MDIPSKLPNIGTSIFTTMSVLANQENAINLAQGFPNFPVDMELKKKVIEGLAAEQVQYAPMAGRLDLRKSIARKLNLQHGIEVDPLTEITVTAGATQGIYAAITALIQPGDEVILFDPAYDCYAPTIQLNQGIPMHVELNFPAYSIPWEKVRATINASTKMIIINNPHNPSGAVLNAADIRALEKIIETYPQLIILSDEVYEHMQFVGNHLSVLQSPKLRKNSMVTYSFGKTLHVTGWKLGYVIAPKALNEELQKAHQFQVFCANNTMQYAVSKYLDEGNVWAGISKMYQAKRDLFLKAMEGSRFKALPCNGTYFMLFDYSAISKVSDVEFAITLTKKHKVATIPVSVFYKQKTDHHVVRVCFAKNEETLLAAAKILKEL
ncbi:aminotransferase [Putridiphycobacter roseus]|uniref:Aminotransferase n=1 Tax=Putridiphycobacter roseus TaxID=2219161 RepID=A0A2W1NBB0_9FLAO|nr:methionine aminotransferase [Putridiphycobacter roseus]PZE16353.1 aminotransferase [Putridiphycobacter roseus]